MLYIATEALQLSNGIFSSKRCLDAGSVKIFVFIVEKIQVENFFVSHSLGFVCEYLIYFLHLIKDIIFYFKLNSNIIKY